MKKQIYSTILLCAMISMFMVGCSNIPSNFATDNNSMEGRLERLDGSSSENMSIDYIANEDGTYTCNGTVYNYKLRLTGKNPGSDSSGQVIVLTNNKTLSFHDVWNRLISSRMEIGEPEFILLGLGSK